MFYSSEDGLVSVAGTEQEGRAVGFSVDGRTGQVVDEWTSYEVNILNFLDIIQYIIMFISFKLHYIT